MVECKLKFPEGLCEESIRNAIKKGIATASAPNLTGDATTMRLDVAGNIMKYLFHPDMKLFLNEYINHEVFSKKEN